jgi:hypothetical protein
MKTLVAIFVLLGGALAQHEVKPRMEEVKPQVIEPWQIPCGEELVSTNFELRGKRHVFGRLTDPTGALLKDSRVLLKRQSDKGKFADYRSTLTDKEGRFELKLVESGKYRFLPGPNRGWKQPKSVSCKPEGEGEGDCELNLVVALNPTDQPFAGCPIQ